MGHGERAGVTLPRRKLVDHALRAAQRRRACDGTRRARLPLFDESRADVPAQRDHTSCDVLVLNLSHTLGVACDSYCTTCCARLASSEGRCWHRRISRAAMSVGRSSVSSTDAAVGRPASSACWSAARTAGTTAEARWLLSNLPNA